MCISEYYMPLNERCTIEIERAINPDFIYVYALYIFKLHETDIFLSHHI